MSLDPPGTKPVADHAFDDLTIDCSAVMAVLREAIDRHTNGDGQEVGTGDSSVAEVPTVALDAPHRHVAAGHERDRRRLAGVVVVLFVVIFAFGYQRFAGGNDKVSTKTSTTGQGNAVTTLGRTTLAPATELLLPPPPSADAGGTTPATQHVTPTTHRTGTTSPPATNPSVTDPPVTDPPVTDPVDTTPSTDVTTSSEQVTTTTAVTPTTTCTTGPVPVCS